MQLLGHAGLRRIFANHSGALIDIDDDGGSNAAGRRRRRSYQPRQHRYPAVPSEEGTKLMRSGTFGCTAWHRETLKRRNKRLATRIMNRELGVERSHSTSQDNMMAQVCGPTLGASTCQLICLSRVSYHQRKRTRSFITTLGATLDNFRTMGISSSLVLKT